MVTSTWQKSWIPRPTSRQWRTWSNCPRNFKGKRPRPTISRLFDNLRVRRRWLVGIATYRPKIVRACRQKTVWTGWSRENYHPMKISLKLKWKGNKHSVYPVALHNRSTISGRNWQHSRSTFKCVIKEGRPRKNLQRLHVTWDTHFACSR